MPERTTSKGVERSCALYLRLLTLYPKSHRKEYGNAMLQLFRDQYLDAWAASRTRGVIAFWLHVLPDLLKTSILEHLSNLNRRKSMLKLLRPQFTPLPVFFKVFAAVFLLAVLTSVVIAFLIPESFRSTAQIIVEEKQPGSQQAQSDFIDPYFLQTEFEVIESRVVLSKAVAALKLCDVWGKKFNNGAPLSSDWAETILRRNLELRPMRNTRVIEISAFSDSPDEAAKLANGVVEAYRIYKAEEARANKDALPMKSMVSIIQPAIPETHPARPNKALIVNLGVVAGILFGLIAGGMAAGFVNANPAGATRESPLDSQRILPEKRRTNLAVWIVGSLWVSLAAPFTVLILLQLYVSLSEMSDSERWPKDAVLMVLLGFAGAFMSLAGISLLREKLWARIYVGIAPLALSLLLLSSNPLYFPFLPGPFRWGIIAFGVLTAALMANPFMPCIPTTNPPPKRGLRRCWRN